MSTLRISSVLLILTIFGFVFSFNSCKSDEVVFSEEGTTIEFNTGNFTNDSLDGIVIAANAKLLKAPITVKFAAGTYELNKQFGFKGINGLHIKGAGRLLTTFDFKNSVDNGFPIIGGSNMTFCDFTAKNTTKSLMEIREVTNIRFSNVGVVWDAQSTAPYGLYPTTCVNVIIENCYAKNALDAGIYSGQNKNVIIRNNVSEGSVFGFEVENSINTIVTGNTFKNNSNGGLIYDLTNLSVITNGMNTLVENNLIENNNMNNFGFEKNYGGFIGNAPVGVGLVLAANDNLEIRNNTFKNNNLLGITSITYFVVDTNYDPSANPNFSAFNSAISIHDNTFEYDITQRNLVDPDPAKRPYGLNLILLTYQAALMDPTSAPAVDYIIESQDYSPAIPGLVGERPYLGQTGQSVIEASYLGLDQNTGEGTVVTSQNLADFAKPRSNAFKSFKQPEMVGCQ